MKIIAVVTALLASVAIATPLAGSLDFSVLEARGFGDLVKRGCLYDSCSDCWGATPPIGSAPGSQGSAAGQ